MKKYGVYSIIMEAASENVQNNLLAEFETREDAENMLAQIYQKNKFSPDMRDVFFDGKVLNMFNTSANCYSNYRIREI